jgi:hypothetical protein
MNIAPFMEVLPQLVSSFSLNENSVGLLACLIGIAGGWYITTHRDQMKAKKAKIQRKEELTRRD